jgi:hypothetical protein
MISEDSALEPSPLEVKPHHKGVSFELRKRIGDEETLAWVF